MNANKTMERYQNIKKRRFAVSKAKQGKTYNNQLSQVCDLIRKKGLEDRMMETLIRIKKA